MPGSVRPFVVRWLPPNWPWSDSTRPIAAISSQGTLQPLSAVLITWAARWYAASAGAGMPLVEAPETTESAVPADVHQLRPR